VIARIEQAPIGRTVVSAGLWTSVAAASALAGVALMFLSSWAGDAAPIVALVLPLAPLLAAAVIWRPLYGVLAVIATLPFGSLGANVGFMTLQVSEAAVLALGALVALRGLALGRIPLPWSPLFVFPIALLAWTLVALSSALDETLAVKQIAQLIGGTLFAATVLASARTMDDVRKILAVLVAVGVVVAAVSLATSGGNLSASYGGAAATGRLHGAFDHPNQLGAFCALVVPIAIGLGAGTRTRLGRVASWSSLLVILPALALTLSRGAWIGTGLALLFLLVTLREARRMLLVVAIPVVAMGVFVWSSASDRPELKVVGERAKAIRTRTPYDGRNLIWAEAIREIKNDPLTGEGPGSFSVAAVRAGSPASSVSPQHAHNILLNWGAENGVPAMLIIVSFGVAVGVTVRRASQASRRRGRPRDRAVVLGIGAAMLTFVGQGFFDYVFGNSVLSITLWGLVGCLVAARYATLADDPVANP
jgi:putative inorganic carbon (HCO3(-)) transporter